MLETLSNKQALADGVLDLKGNFSDIKMRSGRQAFLARLEQMIAPGTPEGKQAAILKPALPADRPRGFAEAAQQRINGALVRCEERYPQQGEHSVLYVVVDREAGQWREKLNALHTEYFAGTDPLAPVLLEVIDRATDEALQRLIDAGLVSKTTRATRPLFPAENSTITPPPLSEAEREKAAGFRQTATRKIKMARLLAEGDLHEEARAALLDAILPLARALAVENRLPEPAALEEATLAPLSLCWKEALSGLRSFVADPAQPCGTIVELLAKI
jgi:hypothetical protein